MNSASDFNSTLNNHLNAIKNRDITNYLATVADTAVVIMLNGTKIEGKAAIQALHADWFADTDWSIDFKIENAFETTDSALACLAVSYTDKDSSGKTLTFCYWLSLLFHKNVNTSKWELVFDQNTNIK